MARNQTSGALPTAYLSNISGNTAYFLAGLPICPVEGSTYTISTTTGLITGHTN